MDNYFNIEIHKLANYFFNDHEYKIALEYYFKIKNYDKQYIIYSNIAACYLLLKNYKKALNYGLKSIEMNLKYAIGWGRVGSAYKGLKMYKESYDAFNYAFIIDNKKTYKKEINYLEDHVIKHIDQNKIFNLFSKNKELLKKLKNKDFRNSLLNIKNPNDIINNCDIINILNDTIAQL
jgi:tetratricopeptide (TPR) repeat protein